MLSKAGLINSEIKSDLIYVPSAEERGDICSHLNGGVKHRERPCSADCVTVHAAVPLHFCSLSAGCAIDSSSVSGAWEGGQWVALGAQHL